MNCAEIQRIIREHGKAGFIYMFDSVLRGHKLPNGATYKLDPFTFSIKELWEASVGPVSQTLGVYREAGALDSTVFPVATGKLVASVTIEEYQAHAAIADALVPRSYSPTTLTEHIDGFTSADTPKNVLEGEDYPALGFGEKYVTYEEAIRGKKEGYMIHVTEETIRFDQTGRILQKAQTAGMQLQTERERRTVRAVHGVGEDTGTALSKVYFPTGADTALYRASESNLRTDAAPIYNHPGKTADSKLEDYTDLQEVLTTHAQNIKDDRVKGDGRPIVWRPDRMLVPVSLATTAANILSATGVTWLANIGSTTTPEIRTNVPNNPLFAIFQGGLPMPVPSAYADEISATAWILYDSRRAFIRINVFPFQVFRSNDGQFKADILVSFKAREWSRCIALDHRCVMKSNGA